VASNGNPHLVRLTRRLDGPAEATDSVILTHEQRTRSRLRVVLDSGVEAGLLLERGSVLHDGDLIADEQGLVVRVRAAEEPLSTIRCDDPLLLLRAAYHLGNRHVAVQIAADRLSYPNDHVLDEMVRGLGLTVTLVQAPFEPETGAYGGGHHHHS
jgi:urease accessory protein